MTTSWAADVKSQLFVLVCWLALHAYFCHYGILASPLADVPLQLEPTAQTVCLHGPGMAMAYERNDQ
jgi:hypothetical protein